MRVERLGTIIEPHMDVRMGTNINGPSLIRAPDWLPARRGLYYLYFADHRGTYIRMAYAEALTGPWQTYESGVLAMENAFVHHHIASPDVHIDAATRSLRMYYHGRLSGPGQRTRVAVSSDGLRFHARPEILAHPYLRAFPWQGITYALTMPGVFYRSRDGLTGFERGPQLFTKDMRHCATFLRDDLLYVFYSVAGHCPESILLSMVDLRTDWRHWQATEPVLVLRPERDYEGGDCPLAPSSRGPVQQRVRQLRDPAVHAEEDRLYLVYSIAGERGLAIAQIEDLPTPRRLQPTPQRVVDSSAALDRSLPEYVCQRAVGPIVIDGELSEPAWQEATPVTLALADSGGEPRQETVVRLLWDDDYLFVAFTCADRAIFGDTQRRDQDIYNGEVVEVFIDADADGVGYIEIEVSPLNAILDLFMLNGHGQRMGLWDWDSRGLLTAVRVDGDATRRNSEDTGWTVEMAIPLRDCVTATNQPPLPGDVWRLNLYRIDRDPCGDEMRDEYSAWSPPGLIDYHTPHRFGRMVFGQGSQG